MEITALPKELNQKVVDSYPDRYEGFVQVGPQKWLLPDIYQTYGDITRNFKVQPNDVWVCGVPRSGTTMTQEIVWLLTHNLDFERAKSENSYKRILSFDAPILFSRRRHGFEKAQMDAYEVYKETGDHRVIKAHLPFCLGPSDLLTCGAKIIYVLRYVKDVAKSTCVLNGFKGPFEEFWDYIENDLRLFYPYWQHVKQGLEQANNENVLIVCYEDLIQDPRKEITRISRFLNKEYSEEEINSLQNFMNYDTFKTNFKNNAPTQSIGNIIGKQESWRKYFSDDTNKRADKWIKENGTKFDFWNLKYGHYQ